MKYGPIAVDALLDGAACVVSSRRDHAVQNAGLKISTRGIEYICLQV